MERLGGILQMTASTCWWSRRRCRTGGARASSPERLRALLAIHAVADERVLRSWVACARRSCGIQPPTTDVYDSPNARAWPRTHPWRAGLPPGEQHADAFLARLAGMLIGALLRAVLAREAWTRFPARCFWIARVMPGVSYRRYAPCGPSALRGRISITSSTLLMSPVSTSRRACGTISYSVMGSTARISSTPDVTPPLQRLTRLPSLSHPLPLSSARTLFYTPDVPSRALLFACLVFLLFLNRCIWLLWCSSSCSL